MVVDVEVRAVDLQAGLVSSDKKIDILCVMPQCLNEAEEKCVINIDE